MLAAANQADPDHERCIAVLGRPDLRLVIPALCIAEVTSVLGRRLGPTIEARFLSGFDVPRAARRRVVEVAALVERYADCPLLGTDAAVVAIADALATDLIVTLDRRHFDAIRRRDGQPLRLLQE
jgi:hypothetical protein